MKKIIIYFFIISFLKLAGCYYTEQMIPGDYNYDDKYDLLLITQDTTYNLKGEEYQFYNDTLTVNLSKQIDSQTKLKYDVKIPVAEIKMIEVEKTDALGTVGVIIGVLAGLFMIMVIAAMVSMSS